MVKVVKDIFDENGNLSAEIQAEIDKKATALKEEQKLKVVFPLVVEGQEFDEKEVYIGYFRQPSFKAFSKYLSASQSNQALAMRTLATDCFVDGDKELIDDDSLFLFGLMGQLGQIIQMRHGTLVNLSKPGK